MINMDSAVFEKTCIFLNVIIQQLIRVDVEKNLKIPRG